MNTPSDPVITTTTLADQVYDVLLRKISTGQYPPGHVLRELDLVAQLGVSRTPIREALLRLSEYGLVSWKGRSARVRKLTPDEVVHIFQVRRSLEMTAIGLACGRLTPEDFAHLDVLTQKARSALDDPTGDRLGRELHLMIARRSGNPILYQEIRRYQELIRLAHVHLANNREWLTQELAEHTVILEALRSEDKSRCRNALRAHLRSVYRNNLRCVQAESAQSRTTARKS